MVISKFVNEGAEVFIPDSTPTDAALKRITHMAIGAHQDDLEFGAIHGIGECYNKSDKWFGGITVTNGSGSARAGQYKDYSDPEMMDVRRIEQRKAAKIGEYSAQFQLNYKSADIKSAAGGEKAAKHDALAKEIYSILMSTEKPLEVLYVHNPFDKHETHTAVTRATIEAIRMMPEEKRPQKVLGYEIWRGLDWLPSDKKERLDVSNYAPLQRELMACFDSQIAGGKKYDTATEGRARANATYDDSHSTDTATHVNFAIDMTAFVNDKSKTLAQFTQEVVDQFRGEVQSRSDRYRLHDIAPETVMTEASAELLNPVREVGTFARHAA